MPDFPELPPNPGGGGGGGSSGGSSGSSSGGSSSSSSSSGSSGSPGAGLTALQRDQLMAAYNEVLRRWGIPATKNLINLMTKAINQMWGTTLFISHLRHTPEYRMKFPGLRYGQGMSEASYNAKYAAYREAARDIGEPFSREDFAKALKRGIEFDEFKTRISAIQRIEEFGPLMGYFREALAAQGFVNKAENVTKKNLADTVMRLGDKKWERLLEETLVTAGLERIAGVMVDTPPKGWGTQDTSGLAITRNDLLSVIKGVEGIGGLQVENITGQQWRDIGVRLRQFKPDYLMRYGISTKDLLEMELGGPRAAMIAEKADHLLKTQEAIDEPRALPQQAQAVGATSAARQQVPNTY